MKIYVLLLFWEKVWQAFKIWYCSFSNFQINASLLLGLSSNKHRTQQFQKLISGGGAY